MDLLEFPDIKENNRETCKSPVIWVFSSVNSYSNYSMLYVDSLKNRNREFLSREQGIVCWNREFIDRIRIPALIG